MIMKQLPRKLKKFMNTCVTLAKKFANITAKFVTSRQFLISVELGIIIILVGLVIITSVMSTQHSMLEQALYAIQMQQAMLEQIQQAPIVAVTSLAWEDYKSS